MKKFMIATAITVSTLSAAIGGTLVSARVAEADRARYEAILDQSSVNLRDRSAAWQKAGWKSYDPSAQPYGADEVRKERQLYGTGVQ